MRLGFEFLASTQADADHELIERCLSPLLSLLSRHPGAVCAAAIDARAQARLRAFAPATAAVAERLHARGQLQYLYVPSAEQVPQDAMRGARVAWISEGAWHHVRAEDLRSRDIQRLHLHPCYGLQAEVGHPGVPLSQATVRVGRARFEVVASERRPAPWLTRLEPEAVLARGVIGIVPLAHLGLRGDSHDLLYAAGWLDDYLSLAVHRSPAPHAEARRWPRARVQRIEQFTQPPRDHDWAATETHPC